MVNEKSKANLRRGNPRNKGNKNGRTATGETWADLIREYGQSLAPLEMCLAAGYTKVVDWRRIVVASAHKQAALGNAAILKELMQRSEPQDNFDWLLKLDLDKLPPNVIEQIANANDIRAVIVALASAGEVGATGA